MIPNDVLDEFRSAGALLEGHFILSSGLHSPVFLQKMFVFQDPARTERVCRALAEKYNVPNVYRDYQDLLANEDIEAVSIAVPNFLHKPVAIAALEAGKHVLIEKPLARNEAEGQAMVEAAEKAGKLLAVSFQRRTRHDVQLMREAVQSRSLGRVYYSKAFWMRRIGIPGWGSCFTSKEAAGGGPLIDLEGRVLGILVPMAPPGGPGSGEANVTAGAEFYDSGIGFAIPLSDILAILDRWLEPSALSSAERERVRGLFAPLAAPYPELGLHLEFRKLGAPNAFALPDGTVVVTDEIVRLSEHDDALSGVLLHEIGHVAHGHSLRRIIESSTFAVLATAYYGDADQITAIAGGLPLVYAQTRYSRRDETEADRVALDGLLRLRKDPRHVAMLFRAMQAQARGSNLEYFSSHPATARRAELFEAAGAR